MSLGEPESAKTTSAAKKQVSWHHMAGADNDRRLWLILRHPDIIAQI